MRNSVNFMLDSAINHIAGISQCSFKLGKISSRILGRNFCGVHSVDTESFIATHTESNSYNTRWQYGVGSFSNGSTYRDNCFGADSVLNPYLLGNIQ